MAALFKIGDLVVDGGGYRGAIVGVTHKAASRLGPASRWYDVRFMSDGRNVGVAIRFEEDLKLDKEAVNG
jgi:hypothetical protein